MAILSPKQKVELIKKHALEGKSVSEVCEEYGVKPKRYYEWQKKFFEEGARIFESSNGVSKSSKKQEEKIKLLESKLTLKNEVLSELMEEHVKLKKSFGEI